MSLSETLLALQELDVELLRLAAQLKRLQDSDQLDKLQALKKSVKHKRTKICGMRKDQELAIQDLIDLKAHLESKQKEVLETLRSSEITHRDVASFDQQLSSLSKRIEKTTFDLTRLDAELEKLKAAEEGIEKTLEQITVKQEVTHLALIEKTSALKTAITEASQSRKRFADSLDTALYERYERARKHFKGLAVETLKGRTPSVCRVALSPGHYHDLKVAKHELSECPYCHRMLILGDLELEA